MEIFLFYEMRKKPETQKSVVSKESCLHKGRFLYMYVPLRFPKSLMLRPSIGPSLGRTHSYGNLPCNIIFALDTGGHLPFLGRLLHFVRAYCFFFNLGRTYAYPNFHCVFG